MMHSHFPPSDFSPEISHEMFWALQEFSETIHATGGLQQNERGESVPAGCPDWVALGLAASNAMRVLERVYRGVD
jgi:hypothetical protein